MSCYPIVRYKTNLDTIFLDTETNIVVKRTECKSKL